MTQQQETIEDKLSALFPGCASVRLGQHGYEIEEPGSFSGLTLVRCADAIGCTPDRLWTDFDSYEEDGTCDGCAGPTRTTLTLSVR